MTADDGERRALQAELDAIGREIDELERKLAGWQRTLTDERKVVEERLYLGERCLAGRESVRDIFDGVKRSVRDETDLAIKPLAAILARHYESEEPGHKTAIDMATATVKLCRSFR